MRSVVPRSEARGEAWRRQRTRSVVPRSEARGEAWRRQRLGGHAVWSRGARSAARPGAQRVSSSAQ